MSIKRQSSRKFYQKISLLARNKKVPLKAMFELTYKCNLRCIHCYVVADKNKKELTTEQVKEVLGQLRDAGCFHIGLTGGEPLAREDIFEILNYAKINGFRISLLTNGYLIDKESARRIASLGTSLNRVDVSVLGATEKTFEKITGREGSFKKVMDGIGLLKAEGVDVQIKATLMEPNKDEFLRIKGLADKFETMFRYNPTVSQRVNGDKSPLRYQVTPEEICVIKKSLSSSKSVVNEQDLEGWNLEGSGRKNLFRCGAGQTEVSISPYGEMNLCLEIHYPRYNILTGSFREGWKKIRKIVRELELNPPNGYECKDCFLASFCCWCPARNWVSEKDFAKCGQHSKEMALIEFREMEKSRNEYKRPRV